MDTFHVVDCTKEWYYIYRSSSTEIQEGDRGFRRDGYRSEKRRPLVKGDSTLEKYVSSLSSCEIHKTLVCRNTKSTSRNRWAIWTRIWGNSENLSYEPDCGWNQRRWTNACESAEAKLWSVSNRYVVKIGDKENIPAQSVSRLYVSFSCTYSRLIPFSTARNEIIYGFVYQHLLEIQRLSVLSCAVDRILTDRSLWRNDIHRWAAANPIEACPMVALR